MNIWLVIVAAVVFGCAHNSFGDSYEVYGLKETTPGNYDTWANGWYKVEIGLIFDYPNDNENDELDHFTHDMSDENYCDEAGHKAGTAKFTHYHVENGVGFPTSTYDGKPEIKAVESKAFWDAFCLEAGEYNGKKMSPDGVQWYDGIDDGQCSDSGGDTPDLTHNCHGYAFNADGKTNYELLIGDGEHGAGVIVNPDNGVYTAVTHPGGETSLKGDIMYMGPHTNYISDALESGCYNVLQLKFKYRCSGIYTYNYVSAGRVGSKTFKGETPAYYE